MVTSHPKRRASVCAAVLLALLSGCASAPSAETKTSYRPQYAAQPEHAKVILVRHTSHGKTDDFVVIDHQRRHLAALSGDMHTVIEVEPGLHTFYFVADNAEPVRARLEAGKTYVIEARPHTVHTGSAVVAEAVPIRRMAEVRGWVQTTQAKRADAEEASRVMRTRGHELQPKIDQAEQHWDKQDPLWQRRHTLSPDDGVEGRHLGL